MSAPINVGQPSNSTTPTRNRRLGGVNTPPLSSSPRPQLSTSLSTSLPQQLPRRPSSATPSLPQQDNTTVPNLDELTDEEKAKVLRRHLVSHRESGPVSVASSHAFPEGLQTGDADEVPDDEPFPIPYDSAGGDITHPIYKWNSAVQGEQGARKRSISYGGQHAPRDPAFEHIHQPGGFRRNYLLLQQQDEEQEDLPPPRTNNFIEFLYLYGHFAGEELEEIEEEDEPLDEEGFPAPPRSATVAIPEEGELREEDLEGSQVTITRRSKHVRPKSTAIEEEEGESAPLLSRSLSRGSTLKRTMSRRRTRQMSVSGRGDATVTQAVMMMLKSFIGTGILFLGKAFYNGGWLFSIITVSTIGFVSLFAFTLLVQVKLTIGGSFGDMGGILYGPHMRNAILFSIAISQIGFVTAYMIFISSNLTSLIASFSHCSLTPPSWILIFSQVFLLAPFAMIRNLAKLSFTALVADGFIVVGLVYIWGREVAKIVADGVAPGLTAFNEKDFALLIGTAVFSFEGIGLVIPITDAMREPYKFPKVLTGVMIFLVALFVSSGFLSYLAFGKDIQPTVIINLDTNSPWTQAVLLIYAMAILLSAPIQLFPAIRIVENAIFDKKSGRLSNKVKWEKNFVRTLMVFVCACISWVGSKDLDKFVALVGCFACLPLCFVYPAMLHLKACARTRFEITCDWVLLIFGIAVCAFSSVQTLRLIFEPSEPAPILC